VRAGLSELGVEAADIDPLFEMLEQCDSARFSPLGSDAEGARTLVGRAEQWITRVERR
jgi:hypothetical protein